jgi:hypothetical protein
MASALLGFLWGASSLRFRRQALFEGGVYVADEVADVAAAVEEGDHGLLGGVFGGGVVGVDGGVPLGPEGFELLLGFGEHGGELRAGGFEVTADAGVRIGVRLQGFAHLFEGHV